MALETFNFCPNSLVPETVPPEPTSVMSMNGWDFSQKPSVPYRRKFKVALHGMNWYLLANGLYDEVTDPTHNARLLEKFYQRHQLHAEFNWGNRSEEHTSALQSLMRISYAFFCSHK